MSKNLKILLVVVIILIAVFLIKNKNSDEIKLSKEPYIDKGTLVMSDDSAISTIYYLGEDGYRYVFPNDQTYYTWFPSKDNIKKLSAEELGKIPFGNKNITYKPNSRLLKIESDPRIYWVYIGGVLREITSEQIGKELFGENWKSLIDNLPEEYFMNYKVGEPLTNTKLPFIKESLTIAENLGLIK